MSPRTRSTVVSASNPTHSSRSSATWSDVDTFSTAPTSPMSESSMLPAYQPPTSPGLNSPPGYYYASAGYKQPHTLPAVSAVPVYMTKPAQRKGSSANSYSSHSSKSSSSGSSKHSYLYPSSYGPSPYTGQDSVYNAPHSRPLELSPYDPSMPTLSMYSSR